MRNSKSSSDSVKSDRSSSRSQNPHRWQSNLLLIGLVAILVVTSSATLILAYYLFQPEVIEFLQLATITPTATATPQCVQSTLTLGPYIYPLDKISVSEGGKLPNVSGPAGAAWWLSDTTNPYIFIFVPAIGSLDLKIALARGDKMVVQWADCEQKDFEFTDVDIGTPDVDALFSQSSPGIVVIVQPVGSAETYVLRGQPADLANPPTPESTVQP